MTGDRRRPWVVGGFLVLGTVLLGVSFDIEPGSRWFYPAATALAMVWAGGALLAGPVPLGRRTPLRPILVGAGLGGLFVVGALVAREISFLESQVSSVTEYAVRGSGALVVLIALVTGAAEELFFRGALYDALPQQPVVGTVLAYTLVTVATGNLALVLAAAVLGVVVALERQASGGVLAPVLTHMTWSAVMLLALPRLF